MSASLILRAFAIGTVAGLRSMTAPAATLLENESVWAGPVAFAAVGEAIVDKLPFAPARTSPPALAVRMLSGALCGAALARRQRTAPLVAATIGAIGAIVGSYGGYAARGYLTKKRGLPDVLVAAVEDAFAVLLAHNAAARPPRHTRPTIKIA